MSVNEIGPALIVTSLIRVQVILVKTKESAYLALKVNMHVHVEMDIQEESKKKISQNPWCECELFLVDQVI